MKINREVLKVIVREGIRIQNVSWDIADASTEDEVPKPEALVALESLHQELKQGNTMEVEVVSEPQAPHTPGHQVNQL